MSCSLKQHLRSEAGFTLVELVLVITIIAILAVVTAGQDVGVVSVKAQETQRDGIVGAVREGIDTQSSHNVVTNKQLSFPAALDSASDGNCTPANPCFTAILKEAVTTAWRKSGNVYTHAVTGSTYTYDGSTGRFQ